MAQSVVDNDAAIESRLDILLPVQEKIVIRTSAELLKFFKNKMCVSPSASQTIFEDGLTRLIVLEGAEFGDKKKTAGLIVQLIDKSKSRKRIILFTPSRFTVEWPASDEHALAAAELCSLLKTGIRTQLFGLNSETERLPLRINFQQEGVVKLPGPGHQPVIEPDVKLSMGRNIIPFLLGEVGVSDRLTYTKLKSKLWIERGGGNVKLSIALKLDLDSPVRRNIVGLKVIVYGLVETTKVLRLGGQPIVTRTAIIVTEEDYSRWFGHNLTPPLPAPAQPLPKLRIPAYEIAAGIVGIPRPLSREFLEFDVDSLIDALR